MNRCTGCCYIILKQHCCACTHKAFLLVPRKCTACRRLAVKLMQSGVILGVTGSFTGVDASGRFKQSTLFAASSKGPAGKGGLAMGQPPPAKKKHKVFDEGGAWKGQCFCGATAKVGWGRGGGGVQPRSWQAWVECALL